MGGDLYQNPLPLKIHFKLNYFMFYYTCNYILHCQYIIMFTLIIYQHQNKNYENLLEKLQKYWIFFQIKVIVYR